VAAGVAELRAVRGGCSCGAGVTLGAGDPPAVTFFYRFDRLLARRIEQADEAEQDEILRQVGRAEAARLDYRTLEPGEPKHAFTLSGELVRDLLETVAVERRMFAVGELLPVAVLHDHFRRALDERHFLSIGSLVQCRHEFVLRLERNGVDSGICGLLSSTIHSELCSERIERSLSGIALHLPRPLLLEKLRVVTQH